MLKNIVKYIVICLAAFAWSPFAFAQDGHAIEVKVMKAGFKGNAAEIPIDSVVPLGEGTFLVPLLDAAEPGAREGEGRITMREVVITTTTAMSAFTADITPQDLVVIATRGQLQDGLLVHYEEIHAVPENANDCLYHAIGYYGDKKFDQVIKMCEKAISIDPENASAYCLMGDAWLSRGKIKKAIPLFEKAVAINPQFEDAYYSLASAYYAKNKLDKAKDTWEKALALDPENAQTHFCLGLVYKKKGNLDKSIELLKRSIGLEPQNARPYYTMGLVFIKKGEKEKGMGCIKIAAQLGSDEAVKYLKKHRIDR